MNESENKVLSVYRDYRESGVALKWDLMNRGNREISEHRRAMTATMLRRTGISPDTAMVIEFGCGKGDIMRELTQVGIGYNRLFGFDLREDAIKAAKSQTGVSCLCVSSGRAAPFPQATFDIALSYTLFSSIDIYSVRQEIAREMVRVVRPGGYIFWRDLILPSTNRNIKRISFSEMTSLFEGCDVCWHRRCTFLPPLLRKMGHAAKVVNRCLGSLPGLGVHRMAMFRKRL